MISAQPAVKIHLSVRIRHISGISLQVKCLCRRPVLADHGLVLIPVCGAGPSHIVISQCDHDLIVRNRRILIHYPVHRVILGLRAALGKVSQIHDAKRVRIHGPDILQPRNHIDCVCFREVI